MIVVYSLPEFRPIVRILLLWYVYYKYRYYSGLICTSTSRMANRGDKKQEGCEGEAALLLVGRAFPSDPIMVFLTLPPSFYLSIFFPVQ